LKITELCVLIGTAGSGKSSIVRNLLLNETRTPDRLEYVPIFIELPKLSEQLSSGRSMQDFISEVSGFNSYELRYIDKSSKKLFLILDGMDEILSSEMIDDVIDVTERFMQEYTNTKLVFTSRPSCMKIKDRNTFSIDGHEIKKFFVEELTEDERKEQIDRIISEAFPELQHLENPRKANPTIKTLEKIAHVYGRELNILL
jgi:predicted NACHT family NTPase